MAMIGIMQGRLVEPEGERFQSFPRRDWRLEFARAEEAELDYIEWIYDSYGADVNPIANDEGLKEMGDLGLRHAIAIPSLCADYFIDYPLVRAGESEINDRLDVLGWLMIRCYKIGLHHIVLPFVDNSRIETDEDMACAAQAVRDMDRYMERTGIELHLETSLGPSQFAELLALIDHPMVRVNYDTGNSASL